MAQRGRRARSAARRGSTADVETPPVARETRETRGARGPAVSKAERRTQILAAARDVFARRGYHQTTVDDIVAAAGVARGTFYLYFDDKRALLTELIERFSSRISMAIMHIAVDDAGRTVDEQVRNNIRAVLGVCLHERVMTKILLGDAVGIDPAFDRKLMAFYDEVALLLTQSLSDGQTLGIVRDGEPRVFAMLTIGAIKELLYQVVNLGLTEDSADSLTGQVYDFLRGGYLRVAPEPEEPRAKSRRRSRAGSSS